MATLRRRAALVVAVMAALLAAALLALALGADAVSLVMGAAVVAVAVTLLAVVWLVLAGREDRRQERREGRQRRTWERLAREQAKQTAVAIEASEQRLFSQLEALAWLRDLLQLARPLPSTRGYAATPDTLRQLVQVIDAARPQQVVELGSGVSTVVIARRLQQAGRGRVVALEHLPEYAEQTRAELAAQGLSDVATVLDAPLVETPIGEVAWTWYELGEAVPATIDVLFVDGPPAGTGSLARYPALPLLRDRLTPGAPVLVDDGDRADEREIVQRWQSEIEGLGARHLPLAKGAWLLTMPGG